MDVVHSALFFYCGGGEKISEKDFARIARKKKRGQFDHSNPSAGGNF